MDFVAIKQAISADGLRIVLVQNFPSPWGLAAKAMMEYKGLDYIKAPQEAMGANTELVAWAGTNSGPVVAWNNEAPINRWDDILFLLERLAPARPLLPAAREERVQVLGLGHEICGPLGIGWNARLCMVHPGMASGEPPPPIAELAGKYGYNPADGAAAAGRAAASLQMLAGMLKAQKARGSDYLVGDALSAADFYWATFSNLVQIQSQEDCPLAPEIRPMFENVPAEMVAACDPILIEHRDRIMRAHFKLPLEL